MILKFENTNTQMLKKKQDLIRSLLVKKVLNLLLAIKMLKKIRPLFMLLPKMSAYRREILVKLSVDLF